MGAGGGDGGGRAVVVGKVVVRWRRMKMVERRGPAIKKKEKETNDTCVVEFREVIVCVFVVGGREC